MPVIRSVQTHAAVALLERLCIPSAPTIILSVGHRDQGCGLPRPIFCIAGRFRAYTHARLKALIEGKAGAVSDTVNSSVDALVCGVRVKGTKKYEKAKDLQIPTISVEEMFESIRLADTESGSSFANDDVRSGSPRPWAPLERAEAEGRLQERSQRLEKRAGSYKAVGGPFGVGGRRKRSGPYLHPRRSEAVLPPTFIPSCRLQVEIGESHFMPCSLLVSRGARKQRPCQSNSRCCFHQSLEV